jgi:hypothetical protein
LTCSFFGEEIFDSRYFVFKRGRNYLSSHKKTGGGVLIAVKRIFDVEELETASGDRLEHVCLKIQEAFSFLRCISHLMLVRLRMNFLFVT